MVLLWEHEILFDYVMEITYGDISCRAIESFSHVSLIYAAAFPVKRRLFTFVLMTTVMSARPPDVNDVDSG